MAIRRRRAPLEPYTPNIEIIGKLAPFVFDADFTYTALFIWFTKIDLTSFASAGFAVET